MVRTVHRITEWAGAAVLAASALGFAGTAAAAADQAAPALAQGAVPNAAAGKPVRVAFRLAADDGTGTSPYKAHKVGDVLKITAPPGTTITDLMCGPKKVIAADRKSATCTMPPNYFWTINRFVTLDVADDAPGGTVTGRLTYYDPAGRQLSAGALTVYIAGVVKPGTYCKAADLGKNAFTDKGRQVTCDRDEDGLKQRWRYPA
jgi:hypothetical protein